MRATFPAIARKPQSRSRATAAVRKVTSRANAQTKNLAVEVAGVPAVAVVADTLAAEAKNATNVGKLGTLLVTALKAVVEATKVAVVVMAVVVEATAVATAVDTVEAEAVEAEVEVEVKPATLVVGSATCLATAPKARSATIVSGDRAPKIAFGADQSCRRRSWSPIPRLPV